MTGESLGPTWCRFAALKYGHNYVDVDFSVSWAASNLCVPLCNPL